MIEKEFGGYLPLEIAKDGNEYYQSNKSFNVISGHSLSLKNNSEYIVLVGKNPDKRFSPPLLNTKSILDWFLL